VSRLPALVLLAAAVLVGCAPAPGGAPDAGAAPAARPSPAPPATGSAEPAPADAVPLRIRIPAIDVDSPVTPVDVDGTGALQPPEGPDNTGWYAEGPVPGATGPAVLAGHVDSSTGPAVFYRLRDLPEGSRIEVDRSDGTTAAFVARRTFQTAKAAFPTDAVYSPTPAPELRLVTCGGTFDRSIGHYRDNVVVEAVSADQGTWTIPDR
jgi:sortase (surface protein transpeptidase)